MKVVCIDNKTKLSSDGWLMCGLLTIDKIYEVYSINEGLNNTTYTIMCDGEHMLDFCNTRFMLLSDWIECDRNTKLNGLGI